MKFIRTISKTLVAIWLLAVIAIGIGGTWLTHNQEEVALAAAGLDREEFEAMQQAKRAESEAGIHGAPHTDGGWSGGEIPREDVADDWGEL